MFALTPGTLLAVYLHSVKVAMEEENEVLRLQHIQDELQGETDREQKDVALMSMIQEMRNRIHSLEQEVTEAKKAQKSNSAAATQPSNEQRAASPAIETQAPEATGDWERQKDAFLLASSSSLHSGATGAEQSGINMRVKQRERDLLKEDIKAFKAAQTEENQKK